MDSAASPQADAGVAAPAPRLGRMIIDDQVPFAAQGVPAIDLSDFEYPHRDSRDDNLRHVSQRSLDAVGETVTDLLLRWR